MHFHRDMLAICDGYAGHVLRAAADDLFIGSPPLAFTFGLGGLVLFPLRIGAAAVLLEKAGPDDLLAAIAKYRATICFTAPTAYRAMLGKLKEHDISSLRKCVSAGEALPKATFEAWHERPASRSSTASARPRCCTSSSPRPRTRCAPARPASRCRATRRAILDDDGNARRPAPSAGSRCAGRPAAAISPTTRQRKYVQDGWNVTGDAYLMDADGYFCYQARSDDMIISAGYNIAGPEVEAALLAHAGGRRMRRGRRPGRGARPDREGLCGAARRA